jgi:hypothetical protein
MIKFYSSHKAREIGLDDVSNIVGKVYF